jgi:hypothetical protein
MALLLLALLTADPHTALVVPEKLSSLDQKAAKIARDIAKEDRVYQKLDATFERMRGDQPDGGIQGPNKNLAEWDDQKAELKKLHSGLDESVAEVRALKASKDGVTVDAARAVGDQLEGLQKRVNDLNERLQRLTHALEHPAK